MFPSGSVLRRQTNSGLLLLVIVESGGEMRIGTVGEVVSLVEAVVEGMVAVAEAVAFWGSVLACTFGDANMKQEIRNTRNKYEVRNNKLETVEVSEFLICF